MTDSAPHLPSPDRPDLRVAPSAPIPLPVPRRGAPVEADRGPGFVLSLGADDLGARARGIPVLGGLAAIFGIVALFKAPVVLGPLGILFGLAALLRGQAGLGAIGGVTGVVALAISPMFWALFGLAWLGGWLLG